MTRTTGWIRMAKMHRGDHMHEHNRWADTAWRLALGGFALVAVAMPVIFVGSARDLGSRGTLWWIAFAVFSAAWGIGQTILVRRPDAPSAVLWLAGVQGLAALAANWALPTVLPGVATGGVLLVLVAAHLGGLRPAWAAIAWVGVQSAALLAIYLDAWGSAVAWTAGSAYAAFQVGMLAVARLAERERRSRLELAGALAELTSTRSLLESSVRGAERTRIARELHDLLGHHLVALGLQLEAASLETHGSAKARVAEARAIAKLLLADVRAAVSDLRDGASLDLRGALMALATTGVGPRVDVRVDDTFAVDDPARAAAFLRCAQEAVTNARRHAGATTIVVEGTVETLRVRDDGRGTRDAPEGTGLRGMRERAAALGGEVRVGPVPDGGTEVVVRIPSGASS